MGQGAAGNPQTMCIYGFAEGIIRSLCWVGSKSESRQPSCARPQIAHYPPVLAPEKQMGEAEHKSCCCAQ